MPGRRNSCRFDILLSVRSLAILFGSLLVSGAYVLALAQATAPQVQNAPGANSVAATPGSAQQPAATASPVFPRNGLNIVVLDPAHGGTDQGARGTEGITESDEVLQFAAATKKALEAQGFQVLLTREGNDNPSFDDRSARANAQRGAVFISLHIASTGLTGTARVYVEPEVPPSAAISGLIPWDRAQVPFQGLSRKLGDLVQMELAKRFKGSPDTLQTAPVRQLRTTAAPAIAVEISRVSVQNRGDLETMVPGVADAIARGVVAFRPSYVLPTIAVPGGSVQP
jgi:N-acetylmuramoyl-L-alanine amidase